MAAVACCTTSASLMGDESPSKICDALDMLWVGDLRICCLAAPLTNTHHLW